MVLERHLYANWSFLIILFICDDISSLKTSFSNSLIITFVIGLSWLYVWMKEFLSVLERCSQVSKAYGRHTAVLMRHLFHG